MHGKLLICLAFVSAGCAGSQVLLEHASGRPMSTPSASACSLGQLPAEVISRIHMLIDTQPCDFRLIVRLDPASTLQFQSHPRRAQVSCLPRGTDMEEFNARTLTRLPAGCGGADYDSGRALRDFFVQQMMKVCQVVAKYGLTPCPIILEGWEGKHNSLEIRCYQDAQRYTIYGREPGSLRVRRIRPAGCSVLLTRGDGAWLVIAKQRLQEERVYFRASYSGPFEPLLIEEPDLEWTRYFPDSLRCELARKDSFRVQCLMETLSELGEMCRYLIIQGACHGTLRGGMDVELKAASWGFVLEDRATSSLSLTSPRFAGMASV
jgi:hypothetical protein